MTYSFDICAERRGTDSVMWGRYGEGIIPLWVAEMNFDLAPPILEALRDRASHPFFGYVYDFEPVFAALQKRLKRLYGWEVSPEDMIATPGTLSSLAVAYKAICERDRELLHMHGPAYPPFLLIPKAIASSPVLSPLREEVRGQQLSYDFDVENLLSSLTPQSRAFLHCNPHNPTGRSYTLEEQQAIARVCCERDLVIFSDELHAELALESIDHRPMASLSQEIANRTVTLLSPSKTFNIAGLCFSVLIIQNRTLRKQIQKYTDACIKKISNFSLVSALAAYESCDEWLTEVKSYIKKNRNIVCDYLGQHLPEVFFTKPEATYLMWLKFSEVLPGDVNPARFLLENAQVALADGNEFGAPMNKYARLNFAVPEPLLLKALDQIKVALKK